MTIPCGPFTTCEQKSCAFKLLSIYTRRDGSSSSYGNAAFAYLDTLLEDNRTNLNRSRNKALGLKRIAVANKVMNYKLTRAAMLLVQIASLPICYF